MSPNEPLPIFRPSRYLLPTLSSIPNEIHNKNINIRFHCKGGNRWSWMRSSSKEFLTDPIGIDEVMLLFLPRLRDVITPNSRNSNWISFSFRMNDKSNRLNTAMRWDDTDFGALFSPNTTRSGHFYLLQRFFLLLITNAQAHFRC